ADVGKAHAGDVLRDRHAVAATGGVGSVDGRRQVLGDHPDRLQREHVAHRPRGLGDVTLDGVRERVHAGGGGEALGHRIHEFAVNNGQHGDVVGIDAHHLLHGLLVGDDVVDGHLGGGAGGGG